ncbi:MAG: hypothetical protein IBX64_05755 [Actinobacteria bacterium]|nr:hypothetical protein [Actinomycetota bacterium]
MAIIAVAIVIVVLLPLIGVAFPAGAFNALIFIGAVLLAIVLAVAVLHWIGVF